MSDVENDGLDTGLFIGTVKSYKDYKRKHQIADSEEDKADDAEREKTQEKQTASTNIVLSKATLTTISDETLTILKRTRNAHNYDDVYMQSSLDFYDNYYNDETASPELKAARQIRRIYRSYMDYLNAMRVRNEYLDTLIEKYGEDTFMSKFALGLVREWIPPIPSLSKKSDDYELYLSGMIPTTSETLPEGTAEKVLESMQDEFDWSGVIVKNSVEDAIGVVTQVKEALDEAFGGSRHSATINNLEDLNKVFQSWYKPVDKDTGERVLFKNAPENIRKRFLEECAFSEPGLLTRLMNGEELEKPEVNMKEMVHDPVTNRAMTREELMRRQTIRLLAQLGWSESRLLQYNNVGSSLERAQRKRKASRKRRRDTGGDIEEMYNIMNAPEGLGAMYVDQDELIESVRQLMRGD